MALLVKQNGEAVVENNDTTNAQVQQNEQATDTGNSEKVAAGGGSSGGASNTGVPEAAAAGTGVQETQNQSKGVDFSKITAEYEGKYDQQLADLYNQITQRKPFEYNSEDDLLYQQYVDRYTKGGKLAMEDTMGQAAALTGGYGNSYAQRVGQQTYDEYMTGLNDQAATLMQQAYQRYMDEGDQLTKQYSMLGQLAADDYSKWADQYERAMNEAAIRGNSGDFDAYRQMWGDEAANRLQQAYAAQVLMPLYTAGQMDAETYKSIAGVYPVGYVEPGDGGSDSGGGYAWDQYNLSFHTGANSGETNQSSRNSETTNPYAEYLSTIYYGTPGTTNPHRGR